ncbi:ubiquitin carboxyl-terminal hydrolase MINDY-1-like isoform X2 [Thrips palmi]|uniref:Ubiquitin carboxyl-terminal hydrolase n=1 Tax=Thrips palmi TaxID=161013 RepID=A0A6P8XVE2_THRPL|nr:ubiquitin carboxyl-terminal hydrolase MINDY-1-like isoform X2 [Thrips palmi]
MDESSLDIHPAKGFTDEVGNCQPSVLQSESSSSNSSPAEMGRTAIASAINEGDTQSSGAHTAKSISPASPDSTELKVQICTSQEDGVLETTAQKMNSLSIEPVASSEANIKTSKKSSSESSPVSSSKGPEEYQLKWIMWHEHKTPIITQNQNGPCPLIAIANILLLRGKMKLSANASSITSEELLTHVANNIVESRPEDNSEEIMRNFEQNMHDAMSLLPQLHSGLDVNVKFTGVTHFEFTEACTVFDLLDISLYHGWVVDPQATETVTALGHMGYNQLVEMIIQDKMADDSTKVTRALLAEQFLESSASQLTYHGLCELNSVMADNELAVIFRNNHFSTIFKRRVPTSSRQQSTQQVQNELFLLVTDQGFLHEYNVVWEMFCNIEGDSMFVDSDFKNVPPKTTSDFSPAATTMSQIDQDEELARLLHKQELDGVAEEERVNKQLLEQTQQAPLKSSQASPPCSCNPSECNHGTPVRSVETCSPNPAGSPTSSSHKKNACSVL